MITLTHQDWPIAVAGEAGSVSCVLCDIFLSPSLAPVFEFVSKKSKGECLIFFMVATIFVSLDGHLKFRGQYQAH